MNFWTATKEEEILQCIDAGQNINSRNKGNTPLEYAVRLHNLDKCKLLLKHGAHITRGLLTLAAYIECYEIVVLLVENGANINDIDDNIGQPLNAVAIRGRCDIYDFLCSHGAVPNHNNLYTACTHGKIDIVDRMLRDGVNIETDTCFHPLHISASTNNCDIIHRLFLYGIDINIRGINGETALINAVKYSCLDAVSTLIDYGADKTLVDDYQKHALYYATRVKRPNPEIIKLVSF